jgi:ABC-type amino acid transport substrate-binding protein
MRWLLVGVLAGVLAGCGGGEGSGEGRPLVVGMDATYRPFEYVDDKGDLSGVSVEIGRAIGRELGREVVFQNINFDGLITALKTGAIDLIISSMTANEERRRSIAFSDPYVKTGLSVLVGRESPIQQAEDLRDGKRRLAVRIGTTGEAWAVKELPGAELVRLDSDAACVMEVVNGAVDGWVYDQVSVMNYHAQHKQRTRALLEPLREEFWAVGLRKDAAVEMVDGVNAALRQMRASGEFQVVAERYLAEEKALMAELGLPFVFDLAE